MIPLFEVAPPSSEMKTVCPTLKLHAGLVPAAPPPVNQVTGVPIAPAAFAVVHPTNLVCNLPCSAHLIKSELVMLQPGHQDIRQ